MTKTVAVLAVLLFLFHQDCWNWDNRNLWMGFLPAGLGYHIIFSILSAALWAYASFFAWPFDQDEKAAAEGDSASGGATKS